LVSVHHAQHDVGTAKESNDSHQPAIATPKGFSNGRDSRFGLTRPVLERRGTISDLAD